MGTDDGLLGVQSPDEFERSLAGLIAIAFARGVTVEGTWDLTNPIVDAPNWSVHIRKVYVDEDSPYDPSLLDE